MQTMPALIDVHDLAASVSFDALADETKGGRITTKGVSTLIKQLNYKLGQSPFIGFRKKSGQNVPPPIYLNRHFSGKRSY